MDRIAAREWETVQKSPDTPGGAAAIPTPRGAQESPQSSCRTFCPEFKARGQCRYFL